MMQLKGFTQALTILSASICMVFCVSGCKQEAKPIRPNGSLRFYEVYNIDEIEPALLKANNALTSILDSIKNTSPKKMSENESKKDSFTLADKSLTNKFPLTRFFVYDGYVRNSQNQIMPDATGKQSYYSEIGGVMARDTGILAQYLRMPEILAMFPEGIKFIFGSSLYETNSKGEKTGIVGLYAIKTVNTPSGAKLKGDHIKSISMDYDEHGRISIYIKMDAEGSRIFSKLTKDNIGLPIAIVLNNYVCTAPHILGQIDGGSIQISGNYTPETAEELINELKSATGADKTLNP